MPSLQGVLASIPGLAGYVAGGQETDQRTMQQLAQVSTLQKLAAGMRAQQEEQELRAAVQQAGGNPQATIEKLMATGHPKAIELAARLKASFAKPEGQAIGAGGLRLADGTIVPPAARPSEPKPPQTRRVRRGTEEVTEEFSEGAWKEVGRGPAFAKLVSGVGGRVSTAPQTPTVTNQPADAENLDARDLLARKAPPQQELPEWIKNIKDEKQRVITERQWRMRQEPKVNVNLTGGRESVFVQRMLMGATQGSKDLANVVQLPLTASTGLFGGRKQGAGLLDATMEVLANAATGQEAQAYNAMATGFQRSLAQIESAGLMPSGALTHQMDAVLFKEGDTNLTKLHKLAQTRQIIEAGMEVVDSNPRVSTTEKAKVKEVLESVRKSVPFTHSDLINLQKLHQTNPKATLRDVIGGKSSGKWEVVR